MFISMPAHELLPQLHQMKRSIHWNSKFNKNHQYQLTWIFLPRKYSVIFFFSFESPKFKFPSVERQSNRNIQYSMQVYCAICIAVLWIHWSRIERNVGQIWIVILRIYLTIRIPFGSSTERFQQQSFNYIEQKINSTQKNIFSKNPYFVLFILYSLIEFSVCTINLCPLHKSFSQIQQFAPNLNVTIIS